MNAILNKIEQEALNLSAQERAFLADRLLSSLDNEELNDLDAAWVAEAERRYADYQNGIRQPIPAKTVLEEASQITT
ncbi:addiction module protein [Achromatium sp. WMS3]|nr:addiction module protein [Achromatium sp. WMS3]